MWDLPGPGIKLWSPALAGGLFTTELPGSLHILNFPFCYSSYPFFANLYTPFQVLGWVLSSFRSLPCLLKSELGVLYTYSYYAVLAL